MHRVTWENTAKASDFFGGPNLATMKQCIRNEVAWKHSTQTHCSPGHIRTLCCLTPCFGRAPIPFEASLLLNDWDSDSTESGAVCSGPLRHNWEGHFGWPRTEHVQLIGSSSQNVHKHRIRFPSISQSWQAQPRKIKIPSITSASLHHKDGVQPPHPTCFLSEQCSVQSEKEQPIQTRCIKIPKDRSNLWDCSESRKTGNQDEYPRRQQCFTAQICDTALEFRGALDTVIQTIGSSTCDSVARSRTWRRHLSMILHFCEPEASFGISAWHGLRSSVRSCTQSPLQ